MVTFSFGTCDKCFGIDVACGCAFFTYDSYSSLEVVLAWIAEGGLFVVLAIGSRSDEMERLCRWQISSEVRGVIEGENMRSSASCPAVM